ncbi:hypothetical protein M422DRAFT_179173, partial [Sphaerobolus stellatus SS14]
RLKISRLPYYQQFLELVKEHPDAIYLDIGCCFGNDVRKAAADGYPLGNIIASDLRGDFWQLGHRLFNTTQDTFPVPFVEGDVFQDSHISSLLTLPAEHQSIDADTLSKLNSLTPLKGAISAIHASALFHLFDESHQKILARKLACLLSPRPGSMIFGVHVGRPVKGFRVEGAGLGGLGASMFCHSAESWKTLWEEKIFPPGTIHVEAEVTEMSRDDLNAPPSIKFYQLTWCIRRL